MSFPAAALQKALYDNLIANAALATAMGGTVRAYDTVPPAPAFPYVVISDGQFLDDGDTCEADRFEAFCDLHVWSRPATGPSLVQSKTVAGAVRDCVLAGLTITGWTATALACDGIRHFYDADGVTGRAVVTFRFLIEPA